MQGYRMNSDSVPSPLLPSFPRRQESRPPSYVPHNILLTVPWKLGQFGARAIALVIDADWVCFCVLVSPTVTPACLLSPYPGSTSKGMLASDTGGCANGGFLVILGLPVDTGNPEN